MKKLLFLATAAVAMASCSSDNFTGQEPVVDNNPQAEETPIAFGSVTNHSTRATEYTQGAAAALLDNNFVVEGVKGDGTFASYTESNEVFDHYNVNYLTGTANTTESNTNDWEYVGQSQDIKGLTAKLSQASKQATKYWDYSVSQYDYVAASLGKGADLDNDDTTPNTYAELSKINYKNIGKDVDATGNANAVYTLKGTYGEIASAYIADLVTAYKADGKFEQLVVPTFRRAASKIRMAFYETVPGYSVANIKFYTEAWNGNTATTAAGQDNAAFFTENAFFVPTTGDGVLSVYYPVTGYSNKAAQGYNQAQVKYEVDDATLTKSMNLGAVVGNAANKEDAEKTNAPIGRTSATATYAGQATDNGFVTVIPQGYGENLEIRIEYDLYPVDGGAETIHVRDARAVVPAQYANWKSNHAYTYIFKISDATNGWTGVDKDGDVVEGLTPITFDAIVVDTEEATLQETITTVSTPSITTYQMGKVVTENNEYKAGDIYATVMDGTAKNSDITLYVAQVKTGAPAGTTVSEKSAELAYNQGKSDPATDVYDKTNVTMTQVYGATLVNKVPTTDGVDIVVPAYKWTAVAGTTYVLRYQGASSAIYKVVKVAE